MSLKSGYKHIALPEELIKDITLFIENNPNMGYKSVPEFIKEAIRFYLRELKKGN